MEFFGIEQIASRRWTEMIASLTLCFGLLFLFYISLKYGFFARFFQHLLVGRFLGEFLGSDFTTALVALHSAQSTQMSEDLVFSSIANSSEFLNGL